MRAITVSAYVLINLIILGMCGYVYLIWSQRAQSERAALKSIYDQQIYYYNHRSPIYPNETVFQMPSTNNIPHRHNFTQKNVTDSQESYIFRERIKGGKFDSLHNRNSRHTQKKNNESIIIIKDSKPRFPNLQTSIIEPDNSSFKCNNTNISCVEKIADFKNKLIMELQRIFMKESDIFKSEGDMYNRYHVQYMGPKGNFMKKTSKELLCDMKKNVEIRTVQRNNPPFDQVDIGKYIPKRDIFANKHFNTCAIISSAGSLYNSNLGSEIDSHDLVLRFNHAPTIGYEKDVGSKTTIRILNSQVVTKPEYEFLTSSLYKNITVLAWDPSNYNATLEDWFKNPDYNLFPFYKRFRKTRPKSKMYILNPNSLWSIWNFLQKNSPNRLRKNPPSSGFLALTLLLDRCSYVDMFEYMPSSRITKRCHYYSSEEDLSCTFGVWHPLAAEKLIAYAMNVADDFTVFQKGLIRVPGYSVVNCN